jgi:hypothetical protein
MSFRTPATAAVDLTQATLDMSSMRIIAEVESFVRACVRARSNNRTKLTYDVLAGRWFDVRWCDRAQFTDELLKAARLRLRVEMDPRIYCCVRLCAEQDSWTNSMDDGDMVGICQHRRGNLIIQLEADWSTLKRKSVKKGHCLMS